MGSPKHDFFRYVDGEESQTDFFVSLLSRTDTARVLNAIHDNLEFDDSAYVRATQRDGLPHHPEENDKRRTIDWVVEDNTKLVGYELKTGNDSLYSKQLREERRKLEHNSGRKNVHLFGVTEDVHKPDYGADASWLSWFDIGASVIDIENKSEAIEIMADLSKTRVTRDSPDSHRLNETKPGSSLIKMTQLSSRLRSIDMRMGCVSIQKRTSTQTSTIE